MSGEKYFTVLSLHISNIYARKKDIAKKLILTHRAVMISQEVDTSLRKDDLTDTDMVRMRETGNVSLPTS